MGYIQYHSFVFSRNYYRVTAHPKNNGFPFAALSYILQASSLDLQHKFQFQHAHDLIFQTHQFVLGSEHGNFNLAKMTQTGEYKLRHDIRLETYQFEVLTKT